MTMMNKKVYIAPAIEEIEMETEGMLAVSVLSTESIEEGITPTEEPYESVFF